MSYRTAKLTGVAFSLLLAVSAVSCDKDEKPSTTEDTTTTVGISSSYESTTTDAILDVTFSLSGTPSEAGIVFSYTEAIPTLSNATQKAGSVDGDSFTVKVAGLKPSRTYYYRAYFLNEDVYTYSAVYEFRTADDPNAIVTTLQPKRLMSFVATLGGQTTMGSNASSVGIEFSTSNYMSPAQTLSTSQQGDTFYATVTGLYPDSLYYYRAFVTLKDGNKKYGETLTLKPREQTETIDLGLKTLWLSHNLGAKSVVEYGKYTAWGFLGNPEEEDATFNNCPEGYASGSEPPTSISATKYDIATNTLGEAYRLPTLTDITALLDSCDWTLIMMRSGHYGYLVTSSGKWTYSSRNTEFNYWTGSLDSSTANDSWKYAYILHGSLKGKDIGHALRPSYISIRPVSDK